MSMSVLLPELAPKPTAMPRPVLVKEKDLVPVPVLG
jgi:hypothetical protein